MPIEKIKQTASDLGFSAIGFARPESLSSEWDHLNIWIEKGCHADMKYMENNLQIRKDPTCLLPNACSIIIVLLNYYTLDTPEAILPFRISKYAYGIDYHEVMNAKLKDLKSYITSLFPTSSMQQFCDTAPVMEKAWAQKCGLGWIGKNSCLISKRSGSYFFIGGLITDITFPCDLPASDHCGNCRKCIDACPTGALVEPYILDARKCISYLTIEHKGDFPQNTHHNENYIFGCDICQDVCPWNKFSVQNSVPEFKLNEGINSLTKEKLIQLSADEFSSIFKHSAIKRTKYIGLLRNINMVKEKNHLKK